MTGKYFPKLVRDLYIYLWSKGWAVFASFNKIQSMKKETLRNIFIVCLREFFFACENLEFIKDLLYC